MKHARRIAPFALLLLLLAGAACGSSDPCAGVVCAVGRVCKEGRCVGPDDGRDSGADSDAGGPTADTISPGDGVPGDTSTLPDGAPFDGRLSTVISQFSLPHNGTEFTHHGKNQVGVILGVMDAFRDPGPILAQQVGAGEVLLLLDLTASALQDAAAAAVQMSRGQDADADLGNNFTGAGQFTAATPQGALDGAIVGGALDATGTALMPVPFESPPQLFTLYDAQLKASPGGGGMAGVISGAITMDQFFNAILPPLAAEANKDPGLKLLLDIDGSGTVTVDDLRNHPALPVFSPDVDINGDGKLLEADDGMSVAYGFTAVRCTIQ